MTTPSTEHPEDDHDDHGGLRRDVTALIGRRDMLRVVGGFSIAGLLAACGLDEDGAETTTSVATTTGGSTDTTRSATTTGGGTASTGSSETTTSQLATDTTATAGAEIPDEAAGPFPADGSNGPNALDDDGILKSDLTSSFGGATGMAEGVPITFNLSIVDAATGAAMPGAAVYLWHCTADGRYSIYEIEDQNYLRGVQVADDGGRIAFTSVFPGCYSGRWPHAHFEVFESLEQATAGAAAIKTSQLALPQADCETVYTDSRYGGSAGNLSRLSLDSDGIFRDGWSDQLVTTTGSPENGYTASLLVRV